MRIADRDYVMQLQVKTFDQAKDPIDGEVVFHSLYNISTKTKTETPPTKRASSLPNTSSEGGVRENDSPRFNIAPDPDKVRSRQAMIESEAAAGTRTLGRPDLANPVDPAAEGGKARRLVDAVDQARTDIGAPGSKTDSQVKKEANARLKADWEGEKARLLEIVRAGGQLNDVDTVIATKIVNKASFDAIAFGDAKAYQEAVILASAYRDAGAEQARAFRQRRDQYLTAGERIRAFLAEMIINPGKDELVRQDQLRKKLRETQDEREQMRIAKQLDLMAEKQAADAAQIAKKIRAQGISLTSMSDAMLADPAISGQVARAVTTAKAGAVSKLQEWWINSILSSPKTHAANMIGNTVFMSSEMLAKRLVMATLNKVPGLHTKDSASFGEFAAMYSGVMEAMKNASRAALRAYTTERPAFEDYVDGNGSQYGLHTGSEHYRSESIEGTKGRIIRIPTRALLAEDQFCKAIAGTLEAYALAHRAAVKEGLKGKAAAEYASRQVNNLSSRVWGDAMRETDRLTFQSELGAFGKGILNMRRKMPLLGFVLPFVTTPVNIFKAAAAKTPIAGDIPRVYRLLRAAGSAVGIKQFGNGWVYTRKELQSDMADALIGWMVALALWDWVGADEDKDEPLITGSRPTKPSESAIGNRGANPAMSIRIGDTWVSYARIEPFATQLALTVDGIRAAKRAKDGGTFQSAMSGMGKSLLQAVRDKTFLKGIGDIADAFSNADNWGQGFGRLGVNFASSWVPNIIRGAQSETRDTVPDYATRLAGDRGTVETLAKRTGQRSMPMIDKAMPKVDVWGRDVDARQIQGSPRTDYVYRMMLPLQLVPTDRELQVDRLLVNWNNQVENDPTEQMKAWYPTPPSNQLQRKGMPVYRMTDAEYADFLREAGQAAHKRIQALIDAKVLSVDKPTQKHIDRIQRIREEEYGKAREKMAGKKAR